MKLVCADLIISQLQFSYQPVNTLIMLHLITRSEGGGLNARTISVKYTYHIYVLGGVNKRGSSSLQALYPLFVLPHTSVTHTSPSRASQPASRYSHLHCRDPTTYTPCASEYRDYVPHWRAKETGSSKCVATAQPLHQP